MIEPSAPITPAVLLAAARVPRRAVVLSKERLHEVGVSGVVFAGPDEGGAWRTTLAADKGGGSSKGAKIGVVMIEGALEQRAQQGNCEAYVDGYDAIEERYEAALAAYKRGEISRLVTVINSPGGVRQGLFAGARRVRQRLEASGIPTMAVADEDCCSAAWVWALCSDKIYAPSDARIGSIGAAVIVKNISKHLEKEGVEIKIYRSGELKMRPSGVEPITEEDDKRMQEQADSGGVLIAEWTAERRGGAKEHYLALKGAVFSGQEAARRGLTDGVMTAHEVLEMALNDAARAEMAEALGLSNTASEAQIKDRAAELRAAEGKLSAAEQKAADASRKLLAIEADRERAEQETAKAKARSTFAGELATARMEGRLTPKSEAALLAHYDAHGEASARTSLSTVLEAGVALAGGREGHRPENKAGSITLTEEQKARAKELDVSEEEYAAHMNGGG